MAVVSKQWDRPRRPWPVRIQNFGLSIAADIKDDSLPWATQTRKFWSVDMSFDSAFRPKVREFLD